MVRRRHLSWNFGALAFTFEYFFWWYMSLSMLDESGFAPFITPLGIRSFTFALTFHLPVYENILFVQDFENDQLFLAVRYHQSVSGVDWSRAILPR